MTHWNHLRLHESMTLSLRSLSRRAALGALALAAAGSVQSGSARFAGIIRTAGAQLD